MPRPSQLRVRLLCLLLTLALPGVVQAQRSPGAGASSPGWSPAQAGIRVGYDNSAHGTVLGAQLRLPVIPSGWVEVIPSGDVTFLPGLKEYQFNADAVVVTGGRSGGLYAGGGVAVRNTIFGQGGDRETRTGTNLVAGLMTRGLVGDLPLGIQVEARWVFLDADFDPRLFTFGVNLPLWGWDRRGGGRF